MRGSTCRETRNVALGRRIAQHQHTSHTGHRQSADKAAHHGHLGDGHICRHHLRPGGCDRRLNGNSHGPRCTFQHPDLRGADRALKNAKRAARRQGTPATGGAGKHGGGGGSRFHRGHGEAISMGKRRGRGGGGRGSGSSRGAGDGGSRGNGNGNGGGNGNGHHHGGTERTVSMF